MIDRLIVQESSGKQMQRGVVISERFREERDIVDQARWVCVCSRERLTRGERNLYITQCRVYLDVEMTQCVGQYSSFLKLNGFDGPDPQIIPLT